eukprot:gene6906-7632_t
MEGGPGFDRAFDVTTDAVNNIYLTGSSLGPMESANSTARGIFLGKYTQEGVRIYMKTFEEGFGIETGYSVVTDSTLNVYLGGQICQSFRDQPYLGYCDALLMKFDANGTELYVKEFGTELEDALTSLAIDNADNVFAAGFYTGFGYSQGFIRKYTSAGDLLFEKFFGRLMTPNYISWKLTNIVLDSEGSVYVTTQDAYLSKFDNTGTHQFTQMIAVDNTNIYGRGLARDSQDNVYVVSGGVNNRNSILSKFSKEGTRLFNKTEPGVGFAVTVDKQDNVYISSDKSEYFDVPSKILLLGYSPQGEQILSTALDKAYSVVSSLHVDAANNLLLAGWANGSINNATYHGVYDAFVTKYSLLNSSVPAPTYSPTSTPTNTTGEPSAAPTASPNTTCVSLDMVRKAEALLSQANRLVEDAKSLLNALSIPSTLSPTYTPTRSPSQLPSWMPTSKPTSRPTSVPSAVPTAQPTTPCVSVETVRRAKAMLKEADRLFDEANSLLAAASGNNDV